MTVWDAEGTGGIEFDRDDVNAPALGHIVENRAIVNALLEQLAGCADVTTYSGRPLLDCRRTEADPPMVVQLESGITLAADLVVAADGANSRVRDMMSFATREWDYGHCAIVTTVQVEHSHQDTCWQRFLISGPLAFLPLCGEGGRHYCSIVWSVQEPLVDDLMRLDDAAFCAALESAYEGRLGKIVGCSGRFAFPLRQRHATDYVQAGVALVADAAHTIHPLAGQGINLGLQDVAVLAQELLTGHGKGLKLGDLELLRRYQRRRKGENLMMMAAMDGFKALFLSLIHI